MMTPNPNSVRVARQIMFRPCGEGIPGCGPLDASTIDQLADIDAKRLPSARRRRAILSISTIQEATVGR